MNPTELEQKGRRAREVIALSGGKAGAVERVCDVVERGV